MKAIRQIKLNDNSDTYMIHFLQRGDSGQIRIGKHNEVVKVSRTDFSMFKGYNGKVEVLHSGVTSQYYVKFLRERASGYIASCPHVTREGIISEIQAVSKAAQLDSQVSNASNTNLSALAM